MRNHAILIAALILISGCSSIPSSPPPLVVNTKPALNLADPQPVDMAHVYWNVVTPTTEKAVFAKAKSQGQPQAIIGLNVSDFRKLTSSLAKLRSFTTQQKAEVRAYKDYYESNTHSTK